MFTGWFILYASLLCFVALSDPISPLSHPSGFGHGETDQMQNQRNIHHSWHPLNQPSVLFPRSRPTTLLPQFSYPPEKSLSAMLLLLLGSLLLGTTLLRVRCLLI